MTRNHVIAVDFDNTIVDWIDAETCAVKKGAVRALQNLKDKGCTIIIHTCRIGIAKQNGDVESVVDGIKRILTEFEIPYDSIYLGTKIVADAYIDDRAIAFRGDWVAAQSETEKLLFGKIQRRE